jgi:hypothetical protein
LNIFLGLVTCVSIGFASGFLARCGLNTGDDLLPLGGLMAFVAAIVLLFEITGWVAPRRV